MLKLQIHPCIEIQIFKKSKKTHHLSVFKTGDNRNNLFGCLRSGKMRPFVQEDKLGCVPVVLICSQTRIGRLQTFSRLLHLVFQIDNFYSAHILLQTVLIRIRRHLIRIKTVCIKISQPKIKA